MVLLSTNPLKLSILISNNSDFTTRVTDSTSIKTANLLLSTHLRVKSIGFYTVNDRLLLTLVDSKIKYALPMQMTFVTGLLWESI